MFDRILAFIDTHREQRDQAYAESSIDLLLLCMYADKQLSCTERQFIDRYATALPWHADAPKDRYIGSAYARVREVHAKGQHVQFIAHIAKRVTKAEDRLRLYTTCHQLMRSDLETTSEEAALLKQIKSGLDING